MSENETVFRIGVTVTHVVEVTLTKDEVEKLQAIGDYQERYDAIGELVNKKADELLTKAGFGEAEESYVDEGYFYPSIIGEPPTDSDYY